MEDDILPFGFLDDGMQDKFHRSAKDDEMGPNWVEFFYN
jgi:hypothetical protein